ncbi:Vitamin B12 import ATP-binding protein BtuD [Streptomyces alboniger]
MLLLATAPWLLAHGATTGALVGALAYVTQSLLPALRNLVHGLGTSGSRLVVVLRRLVRDADDTPDAGGPGRPAPDWPAERHGSPGRQPADSHDPADPVTEPSGPSGPPRSPSPRTSPAQGRAAATPASPAPAPAPPHPALSLTSVSFAYGPHSAPVVEDLDLTLPPGAHLAVVGPSGIGKSTLTALVAGVLTPGRGTIRIDGKPVPGPDAAALRVLIPQEAYVVTGTLAENLGLFRPDPVPEPELLAAAEAVGLAPLLETLGGPSGPVDPAALSAGERQLVALTRAYLSYAPLTLLDEATCHLDPVAEERAERAFATRPGGTLVVVAHRISSARRADRVLVMDGRHTAYGTHDELVRRSTPYRELVGGWTPVSPRRSQPALSLRYPDRVDAVAGPGLAGDGRHVVAHGPVGQVQIPGDLRDGGSLRREG